MKSDWIFTVWDWFIGASSDTTDERNTLPSMIDTHEVIKLLCHESLLKHTETTNMSNNHS